MVYDRSSGDKLPAKEIFSDEFKLTEIKKKQKSLPVFTGIRPNFAEFRPVFAGFIVDDSLESLLRAFWGKKKKKIKSA
jgi:hypothetical protein